MIKKIKIGPLKPEYEWNKAHRFYYVIRCGEALRPEIENTGQCSDHRYAKGMSAYLKIQEGDIIVRCEHSSHAGKEEFSFLTLNGQELKTLEDKKAQEDALRGIIARFDAAGRESVISLTAKQIVGQDADAKPPIGW